jgi:hypothetical protein
LKENLAAGAGCGAGTGTPRLLRRTLAYTGAPRGFERPGKFAVTSPMGLDEPPQISGFWKLKLLNCAKCARRNAGLLFDATGAIRMADDRRGVDADCYLLLSPARCRCTRNSPAVPRHRKFIVLYNEPSLVLQENFGPSDQITMAVRKSRPLRPKIDDFVPAAAGRQTILAKQFRIHE